MPDCAIKARGQSSLSVIRFAARFGPVNDQQVEADTRRTSIGTTVRGSF